ncbi:MAG: alpha/beta fold hydrolase [Phycisphaerales bacterium]|nr:MAG: alpha/beta fold hydrolase [Phycisphaerales bacterium]
MSRRTCVPVIVSGLLVNILLCIGAVSAAERSAASPPSVNRVLTLDGESDFVRVPNVPALHEFTNAITMELWFKASSFYPDTGHVNSLLRKNIWSGEENFFLRFRTMDGAPCLEVSAGANIGTLRVCHEFQTGRWYHLAGTYDGSTIVAYINGARIDSKSASGSMYIDGADLYLGKGDPEFSQGEYFHGALDEIRLWNAARAEEEIQATMFTLLSGKEEGLVAYWSFDDGTTRDQSGHGVHGLLPQIAESEPLAKHVQVETEPQAQLPPGTRERARDRIVHIEEGIIRKIPDVPRLCDTLDVRKEKVSIGDCKLYCEQEGSGTALVLLHGGPGATHHGFHPYFSRAAEFARVVYYDQRGCGLSDYEPGSSYCVDQAADDLDRLREALGIDQWVVLGHSYGGLLAQCYAMKYPESLKGLVLTCASTGLHGPSLSSRQRDFISPRERQKMSQIRSEPGLSTPLLIYNNFLNGDWKRQSYYRPTREQIARIALYGWVHDNGFNGIMSRSANAVDLAGVFAECPIPTLIIEAKWDMSWNTDKPEQIRENHPHAKFVMLEESGHSSFADEPEAFFATLKDFLNGLSSVSPGKLNAWKESLQRSEDNPATLVNNLGWGQRSNREIASKYDKAWLRQISDAGTWLKIGFALYDAKRYDDALSAFTRMQETAGGNQARKVIAIIWQGHMLDLLDRRDEAIAKYREAAEMRVNMEYRHDQYGLAYNPASYAKERISSPFVRLENRSMD